MSGRLRRLTRQVLQLFITFVAWAAGLGLVIGSIVLVATITGPRPAAPPLQVVPQDNSSLHRVQFGAQPPSGASAGRPRDQTLVAFSGHGSRKTEHFNVIANQRWQLQWTYHCAARANAGHFKLLRADTGRGQAPIATTEDFAASGHGLVSLRPTTQRHYLVVISACSWQIKVKQAA